jgi:hypothetical protein
VPQIVKPEVFNPGPLYRRLENVLYRGGLAGTAFS